MRSEAFLIAGAVAAALYLDPLSSYLPAVGSLAVEGAAAGYIGAMVSSDESKSGGWLSFSGGSFAPVFAISGAAGGILAALLAPDNPLLRGLVGGASVLVAPMIIGQL